MSDVIISFGESINLDQDIKGMIKSNIKNKGEKR